MAKAKKEAEYVEPSARVLVRKDEPKRETRGDCVRRRRNSHHYAHCLDFHPIEHDEDVPLKQYDKILFHPKNAIPVDFEQDNQLFVVPVEDVVAVFRRSAKE
jgi:chaperonin GroES